MFMDGTMSRRAGIGERAAENWGHPQLQNGPLTSKGASTNQQGAGPF